MSEQMTASEDKRNTETRPVKVMFLERTLKTGGAERILCNLIESLDRSRVQPLLVLLQDVGTMYEQLKTTDTPIYHSLGRSRTDPRMLTSLVKIIRQERPDIIYTCNYPITMFYGRLAGMLAGVNTHVVALHTIGYRFRPRWRALSLRLMSPFIARLVAVSEGQKNYYAKTQGIPASKIEVIYGAVDLGRFAADVQAGSLKADEGVPNGAFVVGILAALRPEKRHDLFLDAAERILGQRQDVYFFIVGDGPERSRLETLTDEKKLRSHVKFLGIRSDVPSVLKNFDVAALCSDPVVETLPQCLLEAMATGLPVVSTRVGSIDELVVDGTTGFLTPHGDASALSERITHLLDHRDEARRMGQAGRLRVEEHFSKDLMIRRFELFFEEMAGRHRT